MEVPEGQSPEKRKAEKGALRGFRGPMDGSEMLRAAPEVTPAPGKRLLESTLYKEDVFVKGHVGVWGSFYEPEAKRWGYKCCKIMDRNGQCTAERPPEPDPNSSDLDNSPDSDDLLGPPGGRRRSSTGATPRRS
ncbi:unnamed protein product [Effrenium voratum]|nr:unnamed protein product [Effrenium voratum]